jgi:serine protease AprX
LLIAVMASLAMLVPFGAAAERKDQANPVATPSNAYIPTALLAQAQAAPDDDFLVIVQGDGSRDAATLAHLVSVYSAQSDRKLAKEAEQAEADLEKANLRKAGAKSKKDLAQANKDAARAKEDGQEVERKVSRHADRIFKQQITDQFSSITGLAATLTGEQISGLVERAKTGLLSITPNAPVEGSAEAPWSSSQLWPHASGASNNWGKDRVLQANGAMPTIAIVDSGVDSTRGIGSRLLASVNLSSLPTNTPTGDGRGHGTFVAGIAAGSAPGYAGTAPGANIVSVDVLDDTGMGLTSDIIKACQWILEHKDQYNIRVANFSLHSMISAPFHIDPLNRAVEQLWFNGVTVVAAAGNYGTAGAPSGVRYSPGSDPFVITVGAADLGGSVKPKDDSIAPWSAWGSTIDGFTKPEVSAPGRFMVGPVPLGSSLPLERPDKVVAPGYIQLSGTSFSAPIVSGVAAQIIARNPSFTPDQVKGALMLSAVPLDGIPHELALSGGVGEVKANKAVNVSNPPNPNLALSKFITTTTNPLGQVVYGFDSASWNSTVTGNASWNSASWNSASWNSASWNSASWNSASWNSASWNSASWNSASWNSASWNSASWNSAAKEDAGEGDPTADATAFTLDAADLAELAADLEFAPDPTTMPEWLNVPSIPATTVTAPVASLVTTPVTAPVTTLVTTATGPTALLP